MIILDACDFTLSDELPYISTFPRTEFIVHKNKQPGLAQSKASIQADNPFKNEGSKKEDQTRIEGLERSAWKVSFWERRPVEYVCGNFLYAHCYTCSRRASGVIGL